MTKAVGRDATLAEKMTEEQFTREICCGYDYHHGDHPMHHEVEVDGHQTDAEKRDDRLI
jgi:hypothetical protein